MSTTETVLGGTAVKVGDSWLRTGKIFDFTPRPGKITVTPEEFLAANPAPEPVYFDSMHGPSLFDNQIGALIDWEVRGNEVWGKALFPDPLEKLLPGPKPVSLKFNRDTKKVIGCSLVIDPAIEDAMFRAYSDYYRDQSAAFSAATSDRTYHGQSVIQDIHDMAASHGAMCSVMSDPSARYSADPAKGKRMSSNFLDWLHGLWAGSNAADPDSQANPATINSDALAAFAKNARGTAVVLPAGVKVEPAPAIDLEAEFSKSPTFQAMQEQARKLQDQLDADRKEIDSYKAQFSKIAEERQKEAEDRRKKELEQVAKDAEAHFSKELLAHTAVPAERADLVGDYIEAATEDLESPKSVTFSKDGKEVQGTRLERFLARRARVKPHDLTRDLADPNGTVSQFSVVGSRESGAADGPMTPERKKELLAKSDLGRQILKRQGA